MPYLRENNVISSWRHIFCVDCRVPPAGKHPPPPTRLRFTVAMVMQKPPAMMQRWERRASFQNHVAVIWKRHSCVFFLFVFGVMASSFLSGLGDVPFTHFIHTGFPFCHAASYKHFASRHKCVCFPIGTIAGNFQRSHLPVIDFLFFSLACVPPSGVWKFFARTSRAFGGSQFSSRYRAKSIFHTRKQRVVLTYPHICFQSTPTLWIILSEASKAVTLTAFFSPPYSGILQQEKKKKNVGIPYIYSEQNLFRFHSRQRVGKKVMFLFI